MPRVLLIEDNEFNQELIARNLELYGYEVTLARDGKTGLSHAQETPDRFDVSVNVSTLQFASPDLVEHVRDCLRDTGLSGRCLKLEITESALMTDTELAAARLDQLRALGVTISLDDFGTGYSSLSYLQRFKIDNLKIDRSFIAQLGESEESNEIVRTIITLAHNLGVQVTAEVIEGQSQHARLNEMTCESAQGYHYSRPLPNVDAATLLREGNAEVKVNSNRERSRGAAKLPAESAALSP